MILAQLAPEIQEYVLFLSAEHSGLIAERELLAVLPSLRARIGKLVVRKVDRLSCVRFGSARYSVPMSHIGKQVDAREAIEAGALGIDRSLAAVLRLLSLQLEKILSCCIRVEHRFSGAFESCL